MKVADNHPGLGFKQFLQMFNRASVVPVNKPVFKVSDVLKAVRSEGYSPPLSLGGAGHDPIFAALEQGDPAYLDASLAATAEKMDNPPSE